MDESRKLQIIADSMGYSDGIMASSITHCHRVIKRFLRLGSILELGPAEGVMTRLLVENSSDVSVVEASSKFCEIIKNNHPKVEVENCLFEEFHPKRKYDNIILGHVLEHVVDPVELLINVKQWLMPGGIVFGAVPNAHSVHRRAAVAMGLLEKENSLNTSDVSHGHRRVFDPDSFRDAFISAGLKIHQFGGYWLKPLSNKQIERDWTPEMIKAFMDLGEDYPEIAGEIYIVAL
jgi:2-polyprenyl-3-methyl-5-hydroxy-6-metoxy-1,4-benzoquinol methylase